MRWLFKTTFKIASPITMSLLILLPFVSIETYVREVLVMWIPVLIFFATFVATGLTLFIYFGRTGRLEPPQSSHEKLKSDVNTIDGKFNELKTEMGLIKLRLLRLDSSKLN